MKPRDVLQYCAELGWNDPPELRAPAVAAAQAPVAAASPEVTGEGSWQSLDELAQHVAGCQRCRLAEGRNRVVFGEGAPDARLMFVGEGPGAEEDRQGRPFVGQAGKLLDEMIFALGFERQEVFIANVVKCRPPGNRDPQEDEKDACAEYLDRQIELIKPEILVALGKPAAHRLTGTKKPISALRGRWTIYRGTPLLPTFHPAYLLRNSREKRSVWEDLKLVKQRLQG